MLNVLIVHELDSAWPGVRLRLEKLLTESLIDPLLIVMVSAEPKVRKDPELIVVTRRDSEVYCDRSQSLLSYLATLGNISGVRLAAISSEKIEENLSDRNNVQIDGAISEIRNLLTQYANGIRRKEMRIAIIADGEVAPGGPFFSPMADANVIVLPRDKSMNRAVDRPLNRYDSEIFIGHAAIEIASILGMWSVMSEAPVDAIERKNLGRAGYSLTFMRSRVKGLIAPPLPVADLVNEAEVLPVPAGLSPVDNLEVVIERYANAIYPSHMYFEPLPSPVDQQMNFRRRLKAYLVEFGYTIRSLPRILRSGFDSEIERVGAVVLDRLLGGTDARIRPMILDERSETSQGITVEDLEEFIRDVEYRDGRPVGGGVTAEEWNEIVTLALGIADGNDAADSSRELVMPSNIIVRDKAAIAPRVSNVGELVRYLMPPAALPSYRAVSSQSFETEQSERIALTDEEKVIMEFDESKKVDSYEADDLIDSDRFDLSEEELIPVFESQTTFSNEINLEALRDAVRNSGMIRPLVAEAEFTASVDEHRRKTLIGYLTNQFDREFTNAENSSIECLNELRNFPKKFLTREAVKVSPSVILAIAISLGLLISSLATHGIFRKIFALDWLSVESKDFLWMGISSLLLVCSIFLLFSTGRRTWQGRTMLLAGFCSALLAVEYFSFGWIRDKLSGNSIALKIATISLLLLAGIILIVLNVIFGTLALYRSWRSEDPVRHRLGRVLAFLIWVYLVFGISSFLAGPISFVAFWEDSTRHRFLISCQFVGWICFLVATLVIVAIRVKQQNSFDLQAKRFQWAQENFINAIDGRRHLRAAYTQWLLVAASVSRVVWHPLGRQASESVAFAGDLAIDETVLKFDLAKVELSEDGRKTLLAKLQKMFVRRGWLRVQFDYAVEQFKTETSFINGDQKEDHDPVACIRVPGIDEIVEGRARGDRFDFAKNLYEGAYDKKLLAAATNENLDSVYLGILGDRRLHFVRDAQNDFETADEFLQDIVPSVKTPLPPNLVTSLFTAGEGKMSTHLWWPKTPILKSPIEGIYAIHDSEVMVGPELNDSVLLMAIVVEVSDQYRDDNVAILGKPFISRDDSKAPNSTDILDDW